MKQYLLKLIDGATLTQEETHSIMLNIIDGPVTRSNCR